MCNTYLFAYLTRMTPAPSVRAMPDFPGQYPLLLLCNVFDACNRCKIRILRPQRCVKRARRRRCLSIEPNEVNSGVESVMEDGMILLPATALPLRNDGFSAL